MRRHFRRQRNRHGSACEVHEYTYGPSGGSGGYEKIIRTAKNVGISTLVTDGEYSDTNLAASLGGLTYGVSVWDMAKAYSVFANGKLVEPTVIMKVVDRNGKVLEDHSGAPESTQVVDEASAWTLTSVLEEVISRGTGGNAYIGRPSAGKTGTTDDEHDKRMVCRIYTGSFYGGLDR